MKNRLSKTEIKFWLVLLIIVSAGFFQVYREISHRQAESRFSLGEELTKKRDYLNANMAFIEGLKKSSSSKRAPQAIYMMASNYIALTSYDQAIAEYERLVKAYPDSARTEDAVFMVGMVYKNCIGDKNRAVEGFRRYTEMYPSGRMLGEVKMYIRELGADGKRKEKGERKKK